MTVPDVVLDTDALLKTVIFQTAVCPCVNVPDGALEIPRIGAGTIVTGLVFEFTATVLPLPFTDAVLLTDPGAFTATLTFSVNVGKVSPDATTLAFVQVIV